MGDFERINAPRVEKIVASMKTIMKSAKSNKASVEDVRELFAPVTTRLAKLGPLPAARVSEEAVEQIREAGPGPAMIVPKPTPVLDLNLHSTREALEGMTVEQLTTLLTMTAAQIDIKCNH
jgi:hypothetical protein